MIKKALINILAARQFLRENQIIEAYEILGEIANDLNDYIDKEN